MQPPETATILGTDLGTNREGGHGAADGTESRDGQAGRIYGWPGASPNCRRDWQPEMGFPLHAARPLSGNGAWRCGRIAGDGARACSGRATDACGRQNPIDAARLAKVGRPTFGQVADEFLSAKQSEWRNGKHRAQWNMTLQRYCGPLRARPVDEIDTAAVLEVLKPLWGSIPETASRLRGRIETVLDAARARGLIGPHEANPARWRGHLDKLLPKRQKLTRGHHAAMPFADVPQFMARLRKRDSVAALALEFTILTAARTGETLGARWDEIDFERCVWTVPADSHERWPRAPRRVVGPGAGDSQKARCGANRRIRFPGTTTGQAAERDGDGNDFASHESGQARRFTASAVRSATGAARFRHSRGKSPRLHLLMSPAMTPNAPIVAAMR